MTRALRRHLPPMALAAALSILSFVVLLWSVRHLWLFRSLTLLVTPMAILIGLAPIIRAYRRDAYPIGLLYVLVMFFVLRWTYDVVGGLL
jgi:hypothetical protein